MAIGEINIIRSFSNIEEIKPNTNLNSYTTPGAYACTSATTAATLTNCPWSNSAFAMLALNGVSPGSIQVIFVGEKIYCRRYANGAWQGWKSYTGT